MRPIRPFALPECCLLIRGTRQERRQSADQLKPRGTWVRAAAVEIGFGNRIAVVKAPFISATSHVEFRLPRSGGQFNARSAASDQNRL
jgi:hypothetical protein